MLVRRRRAHIERYGTTPDGRIFQTARGAILQDSGYNEVWGKARRNTGVRDARIYGLAEPCVLPGGWAVPDVQDGAGRGSHHVR